MAIWIVPDSVESSMSNPQESSVWDGMTLRQFDALADYTRECANKLELRDWTIRLSKIPCESQIATCRTTFGQKVATVAIHREILKETDEEIRQTVAHELMHCHDSALREVINESIPAMIGSLAWAALEPAIRQQRELLVDTVANIVAKNLPMMPRVQ